MASLLAGRPLASGGPELERPDPCLRAWGTLDALINACLGAHSLRLLRDELRRPCPGAKGTVAFHPYKLF